MTAPSPNPRWELRREAAAVALCRFMHPDEWVEGRTVPHLSCAVDAGMALRAADAAAASDTVQVPRDLLRDVRRFLRSPEAYGDDVAQELLAHLPDPDEGAQ